MLDIGGTGREIARLERQNPRDINGREIVGMTMRQTRYVLQRKRRATMAYTVLVVRGTKPNIFQVYDFVGVGSLRSMTNRIL